MMKGFRRCLTGLIALGWLSHASAAESKKEAGWERVAQVVTAIQDPQPPPTTQEESIGILVKGLTMFDEAYAAAMKVEPENPMRWEAALFDAMTRPSREIIGLPPPEKTHFTLTDVLNAPDATAATKAKASYLNVMLAAEAADVDLAAWIVLAEKHLKAYPLLESNQEVRSQLEMYKTWLSLKDKPMELKFTASDGREVDLAKMRGKVVLIDFWATWCPMCVAQLPNVHKVYEEQKANGFEVVGISLDAEKGLLDAFVKENAMTWPQYFDGKGWENEISSKYGIRALPAMWLINKKGMLVSTRADHGLAEMVAQLIKE